MNDPLVIAAIRKLPARYATQGVNVTRFGDAGAIAAHPNHAPIIFRAGRWVKMGMRHAVHQGARKRA